MSQYTVCWSLHWSSQNSFITLQCPMCFHYFEIPTNIRPVCFTLPYVSALFSPVLSKIKQRILVFMCTLPAVDKIFFTKFGTSQSLTSVHPTYCHHPPIITVCRAARFRCLSAGYHQIVRQRDRSALGATLAPLFVLSRAACPALEGMAWEVVRELHLFRCPWRSVPWK